MNLVGKRVRRTRLVRTERFVVAVEVEAVISDSDPSEPVSSRRSSSCFVRSSRAKSGDVEWLKRYGKVYTAVEAA